MVLEFGLLKSGLFGESETVGEGLGTSTPQVIIRSTDVNKRLAFHNVFTDDSSSNNSSCLLVHTALKWSYLSGLSSRVTSDGGKTWANATTEVANLSMGVVCRTNKLLAVGFIIITTTTNGFTTNSGVNWTAAASVPVGWTGALCCDYPTTGLAVAGLTKGAAARGIMRTTDGGVNWVLSTTGPALNVNSISMWDGTTGYALDSSLNIWKTTDAGVNWSDTTHNAIDVTAGAANNVMKAISSTVVLIYTTIKWMYRYNNATGTVTKVLAPYSFNTAGNNLSNFVIASNGYIYKSHIITPTDAANIRCLFHVLYRSVDDGLTWGAAILPGLLVHTGELTGPSSPLTIMSEVETNKLLIYTGMGGVVIVDES